MLLGQHISIKDSLDLAIDRGDDLGCEAIQIFVTSPKSWSSEPPTEKDLKVFKERWASSNIQEIVAHSIYLCNFASPNPYIYTNSINSLVSGLQISSQLGLKGYIIHLGSHKGRGVESGSEKAINALKQALSLHKSDMPLIIENSAGAGDTLGRNLDEIKYIMDALGDGRTGMCLDTAHAFESGYDIRTAGGIEKVLGEIDKKIGLDKLLIVHLNDSKTALGSNVDRHENIGEGKIGKEAFRYLVNHQRLKDVLGILETPRTEDKFKNLKLIKELRNGNG